MSPYNNIFFGASNIYLPLATDITPAFYLDRVPAYTKALRISIDTRKALYMGVMFFHTKETRLIASGNLERTIPLEVFKSVVELEFTNVTLN
jgi:hypothetical protein